MAIPAVTRQYVCRVTVSQQKLLLLTHGSLTPLPQADTPSLYRLTFTVHMRGNHGGDEEDEG